MRKAFWAMMICGAASASVAMPAAAQNMPYCIRGCDFGGGLGDCSFTSYQQCLATASGRDASCAANPYFNAKAELLPHRKMSRKGSDAHFGSSRLTGANGLSALSP
jgi:hypothetical protein